MSIQKKKNYVRYTTFGFLLGMVILAGFISDPFTVRGHMPS